MFIRKFKKIALFSALFFSLNSSFCFASEINTNTSSDSKNIEHSTINELTLYENSDKLNNLKVEDPQSMTSKYLNSIVELASESDSELSSMGYSANRIKELKDAKSVIQNNSNNLNKALNSYSVQAAAGTLDYDTFLEGYLHDTAISPSTPKFKTLILLLYHWHWAQLPVVQNTDSIGIAVNKNSKLEMYNPKVTLTYYNDFDNSCFGETDVTTNLTSSKNALTANVPLSVGRKYKKKTARYGSAYISLVNKNSYIDSFDINLIYAHTNNQSTPVFNTSGDNIKVDNSSIKNSAVYPLTKHYKISDYVPEEY